MVGLSEGCLGAAFSLYFSVTQRREECMVKFPDDTDVRALVNTERPQPIKQEKLCDLEGGNNGNRTKFNCAKCKVWHEKAEGPEFLWENKTSQAPWLLTGFLEMAAQHGHRKR